MYIFSNIIGEDLDASLMISTILGSEMTYFHITVVNYHPQIAKWRRNSYHVARRMGGDIILTAWTSQLLSSGKSG